MSDRSTPARPSAPSPWQARLYRQRVTRWWWLERWSYTAFILRELSSVFVGWTVVYVLLLVRAVAAGPAEYQRFLDWSASPWLVGLNLVSLAFLLYHTVTFVNLTPQAIAPRLRGRPIPGRLVTTVSYGGWLVVSVFLAWLVIG